MPNTLASQAPPFCPNPKCLYHRRHLHHWRWVRAGFFTRLKPPNRVQRFQCDHCRRYFSEQTFRCTYWLKCPELLLPLFHRLLGCSAFRQIAREFRCSPQTLLTLSARLGRHCLLFHEAHRPRALPDEPLALDGFQSFEFSQFHPTLYHVLVGTQSHFFHGFTDTELRRSGRMTQAQRRRRAQLEERLGRPHPRATEFDVAHLLGLIAPTPSTLTLHSDEHTAYPRALKHLPHLTVQHCTVSSRASRTPQNPLFPINLLDLLIRHGGANHKRETIAHSKRRQSAVERMWLFLVWRNYVKSFSELRRDGSPAMRLGLLERRIEPEQILERRLFPSRIKLQGRWQNYYWRRVKTRAIPRCRQHRLRYAF